MTARKQYPVEVVIRIEVSPEYADAEHDTGLSEEGYERLSNALTGSVAEGIVDIVNGRLT